MAKLDPMNLTDEDIIRIMPSRTRGERQYAKEMVHAYNTEGGRKHYGEHILVMAGIRLGGARKSLMTDAEIAEWKSANGVEA